MTRVLILTASVGEGHDRPAQTLAAQLEREEPGGEEDRDPDRELEQVLRVWRRVGDPVDEGATDHEEQQETA